VVELGHPVKNVGGPKAPLNHTTCISSTIVFTVQNVILDHA